MQDYKYGGTQVDNIDCFIEPLKAGWVRKIFDELNKGIWTEFYLEILIAFRGELMVESKLHFKIVVKLQSII